MLKSMSDSELKIMSFLWEINKAVTSMQIEEKLKKDVNWNRSTINTFLLRLVKKDFIKIIKVDSINYYEPKLTKQEYLQLESKSFLNKFFNNSLKDFIMAFTENKDIDTNEIKELKQWFLKDERKDDN